MKDLAVWEFISQNLELGQPVALLAVLHSEGSSPGRQGFKMAVNISGQMRGSIGGGMMEHKLVELAGKMLQEKAIQPILKRQIHSKAAPQNQSGMICSGEQTVAIYFPNAENVSLFQEIISVIKSQHSQQKRTGILQLSEKGIIFLPDQTQEERFTFLVQNDTVWQYSENIPAQNKLYIIGGGHVALAFSKIMRMLDFELHLFDDRPGLNTFEENQFVHFKTSTPYAEIAGFIPEGEENFVVIMTFGYRSDKEVLKQLIGKDYKYLGLLGSAAKVTQLFAELRQEGFSEANLANIYAPIGIQIKSKTPEEIAISIAAQIIQVKNN